MPQAQVKPLFHQNTKESWGYLILSLSLLYQFLKKYSYNYSSNIFRNRVLMNVACPTFKQFYLLENCSLELPTETSPQGIISRDSWFPKFRKLQKLVDPEAENIVSISCLHRVLSLPAPALRWGSGLRLHIAWAIQGPS